MADDILTSLRSLANRWTMLARDYARASKEAGTNEVQAQYNRGYAEGYYKAATELAALIKEQESRPQPTLQGGRRNTGRLTPPAQPPAAGAPRPAAPAAPAAPVVKYAQISVGEALSILSFAGVTPRDINQNKDNSFRTIFSRWENMMPHERLTLIQKSDPRVIILNNGKTETQDHFVEFAFKEA